VSTSTNRLLIVGCGNPAAGDDSAGIEVVRRLRELGDCGCDLRAETAPGVGLLDLFPLAEVILLVDAVSSGSAPGTLYLTSLPAKELEPRALGSLSSHGWGLSETLELAHSLGRTIPRLFLLGIEAGTVTQGAPRSPAVEQAVALVVERISDLRLLLLTSEVISTRSFHPSDRTFPGFGNQDSGFRLSPSGDP
jgi:hydrogenase maturation protease